MTFIGIAVAKALRSLWNLLSHRWNCMNNERLFLLCLFLCST